MSEPYIAQIVMFGGNFAPRTWAYCDGQLISIPSNDALFSLLGTIYGGDGRTTFALPDLRGRLAIHAGSGPGLSSYRLGQRGGNEQVTMIATSMPTHTHAVSKKTVQASTELGATKTPVDQYLAADSASELSYTAAAGTDEFLATDTLAVSVNNNGGGRSYNLEMPVQVVHYIIAQYGIYPSRT